MILGYRGGNRISGKRVKAFSEFERQARLKLDRMGAATSLTDLAALPGNQFDEVTLPQSADAA